MSKSTDGFDSRGCCDDCQRTRAEGHHPSCDNHPQWQRTEEVKMPVTRDEVIWILVRYIMGEEKKTQDEVVKMLLEEALIGRGLMTPMEKK